jgi:steroid 5-alpha reductase family enzyme
LSPLLINLAVTLAAVVVLMLAGAGVARWVRGGRHDGVDVVWGAGFALVAVVTLVTSAGEGEDWRRWLVTGLTVVWGGRLAWHIAARNHGKPEDPRYQRLLAKAPGDPHWYALRTVYLTQGALMWLVSLPVQLAQYGYREPGMLTGVLTAFGVLLWLVGIGFETVGDAQLSRFRADPANSGKVLDTGLWRYTRHPNYFGDACVWWGLALLAQGTLPGLVGLLSAAVMNVLLVQGSGARLLESDIGERRPEYADYVARTNRILPAPPRRRGAPQADH